MNKYREEFEKKGNYQSKYNRKYGWSYYYRGQKIKEHNYWRAFSKWLESQLEQDEKEKRGLVEFQQEFIEAMNDSDAKALMELKEKILKRYLDNLKQIECLWQSSELH